MLLLPCGNWQPQTANVSEAISLWLKNLWWLFCSLLFVMFFLAMLPPGLSNLKIALETCTGLSKM